MVAGPRLALLLMADSIPSLAENKLPGVAAPWKLRGEGFILVYKFSRDWVENQGQLHFYLEGKFKGGLGYLMMVNYKESPVGPYRELLLIPGKFSPQNKQSITKIYVDSEVSTRNGRINWGIPKETLTFDWKEHKGITTVQLLAKGDVIFSCEAQTFGIPFPASTRILPIDLYQQWQGMDFYTKPKGSGWAKLAKVQIQQINPEYFPDIRSQQLFFAVKINPFHIEFPQASHAI